MVIILSTSKIFLYFFSGWERRIKRQGKTNEVVFSQPRGIFSRTPCCLISINWLISPAKEQSLFDAIGMGYNLPKFRAKIHSASCKNLADKFTKITIAVICETSWLLVKFIWNDCLNWKIYCDDHSSLSSTNAVQIWIISYKLHIISLHGKIWTH